MSVDFSDIADRNMRKRKIISLLNKLDLPKLENIKAGDSLQLVICDEPITGVLRAIKKIGYYLKKALHIYKYECVGCGDILFLFLSNQISNPHIHQKFNNLVAICDSWKIVKYKSKIFNKELILDFVTVIKWFLKMRKAGLSKTESMIYAICLFSGYSEWKQVNAVAQKDCFETVVSIHDVRLLDSICIQMYNKKGKKTISAPHCLYRYPDDEFDYSCSNSSIFIAADEMMAEEAKMYCRNAKRIVVASLPQYVGQVERSITVTKKRRVGVFLGYMTNTELNKRLLADIKRISESIDLEYYVKAHPSDDLVKYSDCINAKHCLGVWNASTSLTDCLTSIDIVICLSNSSIVLDALFWGKPLIMVKVSDKKERYLGVDDLVVKNFDELIERINDYYGSLINYEKYEKLKELYFIKDSEAKYREAFETSIGRR